MFTYQNLFALSEPYQVFLGRGDFPPSTVHLVPGASRLSTNRVYTEMVDMVVGQPLISNVKPKIVTLFDVTFELIHLAKAFYESRGFEIDLTLMKRNYLEVSRCLPLFVSVGFSNLAARSQELQMGNRASVRDFCKYKSSHVMVLSVLWDIIFDVYPGLLHVLRAWSSQQGLESIEALKIMSNFSLSSINDVEIISVAYLLSFKGHLPYSDPDVVELLKYFESSDCEFSFKSHYSSVCYISSNAFEIKLHQALLRKKSDFWPSTMPRSQPFLTIDLRTQWFSVPFLSFRWFLNISHRVQCFHFSYRLLLSFYLRRQISASFKVLEIIEWLRPSRSSSLELTLRTRMFNPIPELIDAT